MKVAIVHDYLVNRGGAERVVAAMHRIWPDAPIYTSLYHPDETYPDFRNAEIRTSGLQRWSTRAASFRKLLPLFPRAFERMDLRGFDLVISSSAGFAHGVRVPPGACHIVYAYSPPRFLYDARYDLAGVAPPWARILLPPVRMWLRRWDKRAARRAHHYVAVSGVAAKRLRAVYGRTSTVLYPPVQVERFGIAPRTADYHLLVGRLLPYRNAHLAVRAFTELGRRLVVIGDGPSRAALEAMAGPTIEFRGVVEDRELVRAYGECRGVIVPGEEDFGLTPLEANASGRPAIAYGAGGARETTRDAETGVLFFPATAEALAAAVQRADGLTFDPVALRTHADAFGEAAFARRLTEFVSHAMDNCIKCARSTRRSGS